MTTLAQRINDLASAVGADIKGLFTRALPGGGISGQALVKNSAADYDAGWQTLEAGPQGPQGIQGPAGDPGITVSATAPPSPVLNQLWLDIS